MKPLQQGHSCWPRKTFMDDPRRTSEATYTPPKSFHEKEKFLHQLVTAHEMIFGTNDWRTLIQVHNLATILRAQNAFSKAHQLYLRAVTCFWMQLEPTYERRLLTTVCHLNFGEMLTEQGLFDEALPYIVKAFSALEIFAPHDGWMRRLTLTELWSFARLLDSILPCAKHYLVEGAGTQPGVNMGISLATAFSQMACSRDTIFAVNSLPLWSNLSKAEALFTQILQATYSGQTLGTTQNYELCWQRYVAHRELCISFPKGRAWLSSNNLCKCFSASSIP